MDLKLMGSAAFCFGLIRLLDMLRPTKPLHWSYYASLLAIGIALLSWQ